MNNKYETSGLSFPRILILLLNYFVGYVFLYPMLITAFTLYFHLNASQYNLLLYGVYLFMIFVSVWAGFPVLKEATEKLPRFMKFVESILLIFVLLFFVNGICNSFVTILTGAQQSVNQQQIVDSFRQNPMMILFSTVIYAPIVEELVFRGAIFRPLRKWLNFIPAALISGISFGLLHVLDSLLVGNFADLLYLLTYASLGFIFCYAYEKNHSIFGSMALHFLNNFVGVVGMLFAMFVG